jgi:hypothetical protein
MCLNVDTCRYEYMGIRVSRKTVLLHPSACTQQRKSVVLTSMNYMDFIFEGKHKKSNLKMFEKFNLTEWASWESNIPVLQPPILLPFKTNSTIKVKVKSLCLTN